MASVNISAQFPKDDRHLNGLDRILRDLVAEPFTEYVIVARVKRSRLTVNDVAGTSTPSVRLVHVEAMLDPGRRDDALKILDAEYQERTKRKDLPPRDMFNQAGDGEHEGQTTVGQQLADAEGDGEPDPAGGPWPGDPDYQPPKGTDPE